MIWWRARNPFVFEHGPRLSIASSSPPPFHSGTIGFASLGDGRSQQPARVRAAWFGCSAAAAAVLMMLFHLESSLSDRPLGLGGITSFNFAAGHHHRDQHDDGILRCLMNEGNEGNERGRRRQLRGGLSCGSNRDDIDAPVRRDRRSTSNIASRIHPTRPSAPSLGETELVNPLLTSNMILELLEDDSQLNPAASNRFKKQEDEPLPRFGTMGAAPQLPSTILGPPRQSRFERDSEQGSAVFGASRYQHQLDDTQQISESGRSHVTGMFGGNGGDGSATVAQQPFEIVHHGSTSLRTDLLPPIFGGGPSPGLGELSRFEEQKEEEGKGEGGGSLRGRRPLSQAVRNAPTDLVDDDDDVQEAPPHLVAGSGLIALKEDYFARCFDEQGPADCCVCQFPIQDEHIQQSRTIGCVIRDHRMHHECAEGWRRSRLGQGRVPACPLCRIEEAEAAHEHIEDRDLQRRARRQHRLGRRRRREGDGGAPQRSLTRWFMRAARMGPVFGVDFLDPADMGGRLFEERPYGM